MNNKRFQHLYHQNFYELYTHLNFTVQMTVERVCVILHDRHLYDINLVSEELRVGNTKPDRKKSRTKERRNKECSCISESCENKRKFIRSKNLEITSMQMNKHGQNIFRHISFCDCDSTISACVTTRSLTHYFFL